MSRSVRLAVVGTLVIITAFLIMMSIVVNVLPNSTHPATVNGSSEKPFAGTYLPGELVGKWTDDGLTYRCYYSNNQVGGGISVFKIIISLYSYGYEVSAARVISLGGVEYQLSINGDMVILK